MTCERCGAPSHGRLCAFCETAQRCEKKYGDHGGFVPPGEKLRWAQEVGNV